MTRKPGAACDQADKLEFVANYYFYESKNFSANHTSFNLSTKFKSILFVHR